MESKNDSFFALAQVKVKARLGAIVQAADAPSGLGDITYFPTKYGTLYLAAVLDLYARRVVSHAIADHMRTELPLASLNMAMGQRRPAPGLLHHSTRTAGTPAISIRMN